MFAVLNQIDYDSYKQSDGYYRILSKKLYYPPNLLIPFFISYMEIEMHRINSRFTPIA